LAVLHTTILTTIFFRKMGKLIPVVVVALAVVLYYCCFSCEKFHPESIRDKRVLVTGASSGIGEQLAYQYSKLGARIVITARRQAELEKVAEKCKELGAVHVYSVPADMGNPKDRVKVVKATEKFLGGLDHLILNHAIFDIKWWTGAPENLTLLHNFMDVNFMSFVDLTSRSLPMLTESKGNIGVVTSAAGKISSPACSSYAATKFALHGFYSSYRQELLYKQTGISVTLCVLGLINTDKAMNMLNDRMPMFDLSFAASASDTAMAILKGVTNGVYEVYYPKMAMYMVALHKLCPEYLENYMGRYFLNELKV